MTHHAIYSGLDADRLHLSRLLEAIQRNVCFLHAADQALAWSLSAGQLEQENTRLLSESAKASLACVCMPTMPRQKPECEPVFFKTPQDSRMFPCPSI